ncbi:MAG: hypothetical protein LBQ55_06740 [Treponema sp.]|jgi:hypothetical protein|nr:hypothetical protein [Treponema sp.]
MKTKQRLLFGFAVLLITVMAITAGCDTGTGGGFVPVTDITNSSVPTAAIKGLALTLHGTVEPADATNKTIVWSGAGVSNGVLTAASAGTYTVAAVIANGAAPSSPYTETFNITAYDTTNTNDEGKLIDENENPIVDEEGNDINADNPFEGKTWTFTSDLLGGAEVAATCDASAWQAVVANSLFVVEGTYTAYGRGAEWIITRNDMDSSWVGDTGIAILQQGGNLAVSNFKNLLMNGTYTPDND